MSTLKERLRADLNAARKERDKPKTLLLTTTLSELRNREIEIGRDAADADVLEVIGRAIKRRREAASTAGMPTGLSATRWADGSRGGRLESMTAISMSHGPVPRSDS